MSLTAYSSPVRLISHFKAASSQSSTKNPECVDSANSATGAQTQAEKSRRNHLSINHPHKWRNLTENREGWGARGKHPNLSITETSKRCQTCFLKHMCRQVNRKSQQHSTDSSINTVFFSEKSLSIKEIQNTQQQNYKKERKKKRGGRKKASKKSKWKRKGTK